MTIVTKPRASSEEPAAPAPRWALSERNPWRLMALSMLTLFVELALIRWTAANNVQLANITNFVF